MKLPVMVLHRYWSFPILLVLYLMLVGLAECGINEPNYLIGVGSYDITGPSTDVNFMGYAKSDQNGAGIHFRQRARSFIVADKSNDKNRVLFVNLDSCMGAQGVTLHVLERLKSRYGGLYTSKNVAISGTHTHSTPGGFLQYVLYIVTSLGFVRQTFDALVDGIEQSIIQAHTNLRPGSVFYNEGELLEANINRSPSAYLNNPAEERAKYPYDVDKTMVLAKFVDSQWGPVGAFSWFAVHGTSMNNSNKLVSGDNKGAAARFMEDWFSQQHAKKSFNVSLRKANNIEHDVDHPSYSRVDDDARAHAAFLKSIGGQPSTRLSSVVHRVRNPSRQATNPPFVAAFCQSNVGDTTPNVLGAFCLDTGLPCDFNTSTCNGKNELCMGRGPAYPGDDFESTKIIGQRQAQKAQNLFQSASEQLAGKVDSRQTYVDFSSVTVTLPSGSNTTCPAAVGFSFAGGTTDGVGAFDFKQGDVKGNAFWKVIGGLLKAPSAQQVVCHAPKPILIDTGEMFQPYAWAPAVLPLQILRIGQLVILSVPGEFTTMAGRRLRDAVKNTLVQHGNGEFGQETHVIIAGLTNTYSSYVTTFEEYQIQRYEGASTIYGPHTLSAYIQEFTKLATALAVGADVPSGPSPPDMIDEQMSFLPGVVLDATPEGVNFGDLKQDVPANSVYKIGDVVEAIFYTGSPRNDLLTEGTFALVEILDSTGTWVGAYDDDDWSTKFLWARPSSLSPISFATIRWEIPESVQPGTYRLRHFGANKVGLIGSSVNHFTGTSSAFVVN